MEISISEIIYTFLYCVLCKMFVEIFMRKRKDFPIYIMWFLLIVLTMFDYFASVFLAQNFAIKQIAIVLFGTITMWICYRGRLLKIVLIILFYQGLCFITDYIAWMVLQKMLAFAIVKTNILELFLGTLSQVLVFCIIVVLHHHFAQDSAESLTSFEWAKFSVFPLFTIVSIIAMLINFDGLSNEKQINTLICLAVGMLILNIFVFYLLWDAIEREVKIRRQQLSIERAKSETAMYQQISENFDKQKKREHEYKNEIMVISSLLKQNEIEKLHILLDGYSNRISNRFYVIDTKNVIVNVILNTKYQEARDKGIVFVLKINDLSEISMEDQDIVVILSNMLNNAIEACAKCKEKRIIKVKAVKEGERIIFSVINTIQEIPHIVDGKYKTTKEENQFHGMGIENVKEIVSKYGGTCVIRYDKEYFYFVVYLSK